jgi:hypothetical protein
MGGPHFDDRPHGGLVGGLARSAGNEKACLSLGALDDDNDVKEF